MGSHPKRMKWLIFVILNEDKWIWKSRIRRKKEGKGGFGEWVSSLAFVAKPSRQELGWGFRVRKRTAQNYLVRQSRAQTCSLILCFLGYLMKYWWETWEVRGPGWLGVGGVGVGSITAASCGSGHLCQSGSASDGPRSNLIWLQMSPYHRRWKNKKKVMCSQNISNMS